MRGIEIILSGFGGQGILSAGRILAYAGMLDNMKVSMLPSYGPEMRGGTANCHVILSEEAIASPILTSTEVLLAMNEPSLERFASSVNRDGLILTDSSLIKNYSTRKDVNIVKIPATKIAVEIGNITFANIIMLGRLIKETNIVNVERIRESLYKVLPEKKHYLIPEEIKALEIGIKFMA